MVLAAPAFRPDGTLYSERYGDVYASSDGAAAETAHVFLHGNALPSRWRDRSTFAIVETGFGAGLNFLVTWSAWRANAPASARLHYLSVEKHPFAREDLERIHRRWPGLADLSAALLGRYPPPVPGFQRIRLDDGRVSLTLLLGEGAEMLRELSGEVDAFYLDGFAPSRNPDLWSGEIFREIGRLARPGATAATYSVAGVVRDGLAAAGFAVEKREGYGRKRHMLVARKGSAAVHATGSPRSAVVIGAGLAGTASAAHLAARGWSVDLVERYDEAGREASGNPAGLLMPAFSLDWNPPTRLTVQALAYSRCWLDELSSRAADLFWRPSGIVQLARGRDHFERQCRIARVFDVPASLLRMVDRDEAAAIVGWPVGEAGWWLPSAGWADPKAVCAAAAIGGVRTLWNSQVRALRRSADQWDVLGKDGALIARAPVVVIANALGARAIEDCQQLPLEATRGQVTLLPEHRDRRIAVPVCREGFITPAADGFHCVGASYNLGSNETNETLADHEGNLQRLERIVPGFGEGASSRALRGRVGFRAVAPDRMPIVGPLAGSAQAHEAPGLYACVGLASRGLTWAPLLAETLACLIEGEPLPIERSLMELVAPARFAARG